MNVYISNCPNTFNYGSMMMGENFITYFNKACGLENRYYVETRDDKNIQRLMDATGSSDIHPVPMDHLLRKGLSKYDYLLSLLKMKKITFDFLDNIDLVVVLGGDDFTEDYGWKEPILRAIEFNQVAREGLPVVLLGQTMGPYHSFRVPFMKNLLKGVSRIYPRDQRTYNYLNQIGMKNISLTDDLALLPLTRQQEEEGTKGYITYCPSELIYRYTIDGSRKNWIDFNLFMIDRILEWFPDKKLILLAHVLKPEDADDRVIVNELYNLTTDKYSGRIVAKNEEMLPWEARQLIARSALVVSARMHPVISAIQCLVPSISLSYSTKFWGIVGDRYELGRQIIDVRTLNYDEMKETFANMLECIEEEWVKMEGSIKRKNELAAMNIEKTLRELTDLRRG